LTAFRWGIFGAGSVAHKFAMGLRATHHPATTVAVASRDPANARRLASALGARAGTYRDLVGAGDVDAVYIATPPAVHADQALMCIEASIPVLIEKPFAIDAASARQIADAASREGVFVMEAMWTRFLPLLAEIRARVAAGDLGEVRAFSGSFAIADARSGTDSNFNALAGGGALMHRGVYPLSLACNLLGPVTAISGQLRTGETGVDEDAMATARHESGAITQLHASLVTSARNDFMLMGTTGLLKVEAPIYRPSAMLLTPVGARTRTADRVAWGRISALRESGLAQGVQQRLTVARRVFGPGGRRILRPYAGNGYGHEADAVMDSVRGRLTEHPLMPVGESVHVMELMDRLRAGE
jgi:predicted dehydrogenase